MGKVLDIRDLIKAKQQRDAGKATDSEKRVRQDALKQHHQNTQHDKKVRKAAESTELTRERFDRAVALSRSGALELPGEVGADGMNEAQRAHLASLVAASERGRRRARLEKAAKRIQRDMAKGGEDTRGIVAEVSEGAERLRRSTEGEARKRGKGALRAAPDPDPSAPAPRSSQPSTQQLDKSRALHQKLFGAIHDLDQKLTLDQAAHQGSMERARRSQARPTAESRSKADKNFGEHLGDANPQPKLVLLRKASTPGAQDVATTRKLILAHGIVAQDVQATESGVVRVTFRAESEADKLYKVASRLSGVRAAKAKVGGQWIVLLSPTETLRASPDTEHPGTSSGELHKGGPYIGPRGGRWADPKHTIPWGSAAGRGADVGRSAHLITSGSHIQAESKRTPTRPAPTPQTKLDKKPGKPGVDKTTGAVQDGPTPVSPTKLSTQKSAGAKPKLTVKQRRLARRKSKERTPVEGAVEKIKTHVLEVGREYGPNTITAQKVAERVKVSLPMARRELTKLESAGLLSSMSTPTWVDSPKGPVRTKLKQYSLTTAGLNEARSLGLGGPVAEPLKGPKGLLFNEDRLRARAKEEVDKKTASSKDMADALDHMRDAGDEGRELDPKDFAVTHKTMTLDEIGGWTDFGSWPEWDEGELEDLSGDELRDELESFRGKEWADRAMGWIKTGDWPAVVMVKTSEGDQDVGDGRGRISLALGLGKKDLPATVMTERAEKSTAQPSWMAGNLGIERADMPQIRSFHREEWLDELRKKGIRVRTTWPKAGDLKATQRNVHAKMLARVAAGTDSGAGGAAVAAEKPILVSSDGFILDGHHRWGQLMAAGTPDEHLRAVEVSLPITELLAAARKFSKVEFHKSDVLTVSGDLIKAGPFMGPKGGLWADAKHTIAWKPDYKQAGHARIEAMGRQHARGDSQKYTVSVLKEHGVEVHPDAPGAEPEPEPPKLRRRLFHSAPASAMSSIADEGLSPEAGGSTFKHGSYGSYGQGKVFLSADFDAAERWHNRVSDVAEANRTDEGGPDPAVMLRVKHRSTRLDKVGDKDISGSRYTPKAIPTEHIEFWHPNNKAWHPVEEWHDDHASHSDASLRPDSDVEAHGVRKSFYIPEGEPGWIQERHAAAELREDAERVGMFYLPPETAAEQAERRAAFGRTGPCAPALVLKKAAYKLQGRLKFQGLDISVEQRKGSVRHWTDEASGESGSTKMVHPYGYIRGSHGNDGDHVDVFIGPDKKATHAFVINQMSKPDFKKFDEQKVMLGWDDADKAKAAYLLHYDDDGFFGSMRAMPMDEFKRKVLNTSERQPLVKRLVTIDELAKASPGAGWHAIPNPRGGKKGWRKRRSKGGYDYHYDDQKPSAHKKTTEADWADLNFDTDATKWVVVKAHKLAADVIAWVAGGIDPHSKHPVKIAGDDAHIWQISNPDHREDFAVLVDVNPNAAGERATTIERHSNIYPVRYDPKAKKPRTEPKAIWEPEGRPESKKKGVGSVGEKLRVYEDSTAKKGTALHRIENGFYKIKEVTRIEHDASGNPITTTFTAAAVPDGDKMLLIDAFTKPYKAGGKLRASAAQAQIRKTLKLMGITVPKDSAAMDDLKASAVEGMLHCIENYAGTGPFAGLAKRYIENYVRLHAAREFRGIPLSKRHAALLGKFIAARVQAQGLHGTDQPSAEQIARMWHIKKRDLHDEPQRARGVTIAKEKRLKNMNAPVPMGSYVLKTGRMHQIGTGGQVEQEHERRPGKVELAEGLLGFLNGQASSDSDWLESEVVLPEVGIGFGLTESERIMILQDISVVIESMKNRTVVLGEGRKQGIYRTDNAKLIDMTLGLTGEKKKRAGIAHSLEVEKWNNTANEWQRMKPRAKDDIVPHIYQDVMEAVRTRLKQLGSPEAAEIIGRAQSELEPPEHEEGSVRATWGDYFKARMQAVGNDRIRDWRKSERDRMRKLADRYRHEAAELPEGSAEQLDKIDKAENADNGRKNISGVGRKQARAIIVQNDLSSKPATEAWFKTASGVAVDAHIRPGFEEGHVDMTLTDPATGATRRVRVSTIKDLRADPARTAQRLRTVQTNPKPLKKADDGVDLPPIPVLHGIANWPRTMELLFGSDDPEVTAATPEHARLFEWLGFI